MLTPQFILPMHPELVVDLPARTMVRCHRMTEKRIREIFGRIDHLPDGVHVMAI